MPKPTGISRPSGLGVWIQVGPVSTAGTNPYVYSRTLTIDHTKVPSDQTNFPVLVSFTNATLKTVGNSGHVQNASGFDIVFFSNAALTSTLNFEIESYSATAGTIVMWVMLPTVSSTVDTVFYMGYGNTTISTSQANPTAVWDTSTKAVWHLPNGTSLTALDSTTNANNGTVTNAVAVVGEIDGGADFSPATSQIDCGTGASISGLHNAPATWSFWYNPLAVTHGCFMERNDGNTVGAGWMIQLDGASVLYRIETTGSDMRAGIAPGAASTWTKIDIVGDGSLTAANQLMYKNGALQAHNADTNGTGSSGSSIADHFFMGKASPSEIAYAGYLDEVRIATTARSANWITATYNNESAPTVFVTLGAETPT